MSSVIKGKTPEFAILLQGPEVGGIPYDVTFQLVESEGNTMTEEGSDKGVKKVKKDKREIKAHKFILAASSPVFKGMFFGPMKESKDVIDVKETTFESFKKLIEYIYHVDIDCRDMSLVELYDIVNLAELYNIPKLMEELMMQMENFPISMDNLMEVAVTASEYSQFEIVSDAVIVACAKVLQKTLSDPAEGMGFTEFTQTQFACGNGQVALRLLALVDVKQLIPPVKCDNCEEKPCIRGQTVPYAKMRPGLKIRMAGYYPNECHNTVMERSGNQMTIRRCHARNTDVAVKRVGGEHVTVTARIKSCECMKDFSCSPVWDDNGVPKMTFVYSC